MLEVSKIRNRVALQEAAFKTILNYFKTILNYFKAILNCFGKKSKLAKLCRISDN